MDETNLNICTIKFANNSCMQQSRFNQETSKPKISSSSIISHKYRYSDGKCQKKNKHWIDSYKVVSEVEKISAW